MLRRLPWRTFLTAFILSLCVLGLLCAFFLIECHIQQTSYGQVNFGVTYAMENGIPVVCVDGKPFATPDALASFADVAAPPPVKLLAAVWQWETKAAQWVWEQLIE